MEMKPIKTFIETEFSDAKFLDEPGLSSIAIEISANRHKALMAAFQSQNGLGFDLLETVVATHVGQGCELYYFLLKTQTAERVVVKVETSLDQEVLSTVSGFWPAAGVMENEVSELFGVLFKGNPLLEHRFLDAGTEGFPLRKDFDSKGRAQ